MPRSTQPPGQLGAALNLALAQLAQDAHNASVAQAEAEVSIRVRDDSIRNCRRLGASFAVIAGLTGISKSRVHQIEPGPGDLDLEDEDGTLEQAQAI